MQLNEKITIENVKKGLRVRCITESEFDFFGKVGETYTVSDHSNKPDFFGGSFVSWIKLEEAGSNQKLSASRFVVCKDIKIEKEHSEAKKKLIEKFNELKKLLDKYEKEIENID